MVKRFFCGVSIRSDRRHRWTVFAVCLAVWLLGGCGSVGYYSQAVGGHLKLMAARQPIDKLLLDNSLDTQLRHKLQTLMEARQFAIDELLLPDNDSYSTYVETGRRAVTWNVVATEEFSLQARTWCFPIAGCVSYRGYFDEADAQAYADALMAESLDVTVGGASAYSTLGWFDDPVLDTMLRGGDLRYIGTLFHELAHQVLYVKDDSDFNEAFASFIEQVGTRKWLALHSESNKIEDYDESLKRVEEFVNLLKETRDDLQSLYAQTMPEDEMRLHKKTLFANMQQEYLTLKQSWNGYAGYDGWFQRELNNARLVAVATYWRYIPAFYAMFEESNNDLEQFYALAAQVAELPHTERKARLSEYLQRVDH